LSEGFQANNVGDLSAPENKLTWIFTAFDADGGGTIDANEIRLEILQKLFFLNPPLSTAAGSQIRVKPGKNFLDFLFTESRSTALTMEWRI
jgi:hypothetical protein